VGAVAERADRGGGPLHGVRDRPYPARYLSASPNLGCRVNRRHSRSCSHGRDSAIGAVAASPTRAAVARTEPISAPHSRVLQSCHHRHLPASMMQASVTPLPSACPSHGRLHRAFGGRGDIGASGWGPPDQDARFRPGELPPLGLLGPVVVSTKRPVPSGMTQTDHQRCPQCLPGRCLSTEPGEDRLPAGPRNRPSRVITEVIADIIGLERAQSDSRRRPEGYLGAAFWPDSVPVVLAAAGPY
jgi:hypothetical protein